MHREDHLSEEELLFGADRELPARRAVEIRGHLTACWECRNRMSEIETTLADFVRTRRGEMDPELPPIEGPRALLKARLGELARTTHQGRWRKLFFMAHEQRLALAFIAVLLVVVFGAATIRLYDSQRADFRLAPNPLPNPELTPGSTRAASLAALCSMDHDEVVSAVPTGVRQEVFREYGIASAPASDYEIDYLITPGLGGSDDIRNLWPEPHYNTAWNSFVKDQLEEHLHDLVCGGKLSLAKAQQDLARDWISAYKRYFRTDEPLDDYSTSAPADSERRFDYEAARPNSPSNRRHYGAEQAVASNLRHSIPLDQKIERSFGVRLILHLLADSQCIAMTHVSLGYFPLPAFATLGS